MTDLAAPSIADLLRGYAQLAEDAGLGVYDPERVWTASDTEVAITFGSTPENPPACLTFTGYVISDDPEHTDAVWAVQARLRAPGDQLLPLADRSAALFAVLEGRRGDVFGPLTLVIAWRQAGGPMGLDKTNRQTWSDTYYNRLSAPTSNRLD